MNLKRLIPIFLWNKLLANKEKKKLKTNPTKKVQEENLRSMTREELEDVLQSSQTGENWNKASKIDIQSDIPKNAFGVNPGDRRAIFHLVNGLGCQSVLEIGTHIGASTTNIGLAIRDTVNPKLITVDIKDVNDEKTKPWVAYGCKYSPKELINRIDCNHFVDFKAEDSLKYLEDCNEKFDFIFLDGDHRASAVYREIPLASRLLNPNGVILLHDYFPNNIPLWPKTRISPGPFLAGERVMAENKGVKILPLGELPWSTKMNSNFTSLAILTAK